MPDRRLYGVKKEHIPPFVGVHVFFLFFRRGLFSDDDISDFRICRVFHNDALDNAIADDFGAC